MSRRKSRSKPIESYTHTDQARTNNPPVGLVDEGTNPDTGGETRTYQHDPHIDPHLSWAGKAGGTSFEVPTVSLHVHERIDPRTIIEAVRKGNGQSDQPSLFEGAGENPPLRRAIEFYRHRHGWSNRLIAGDSLLVMNSLLEKEGMGGQVQMVYVDPPYGIKYGSNFQPFVDQRTAQDGKDADLTAEPEMIKAFRDTWELGIHSYLSYLRDRLLLARELLTPSGSCFVQIGDENVHRVGLMMDEVFGAENRVATISFVTTGSSSSRTLAEVASYVLWYSRSKKEVKYQQLYEQLDRKAVVARWDRSFSPARAQLPDGTARHLDPHERFDPNKHLPPDTRLYQRMPLTSQGASNTGRTCWYEYDGVEYHSGDTRQWRVLC